MNVFLQIGLGLLPAAIVVVILLLARKAFNAGKVIFATMLLVISAGGIILGLIGTNAKRNGYSSLSKKEMMEFANALIQEGAYDEFNEVIDQYSKTYGYDDECRLAVARVELLLNNFDSAASLYGYLCENTKLVSADDAEVQAAVSRLQGDLADLVMMDYLKNNNENPLDYGYDSADPEELRASLTEGEDDIEKIVNHAINEDYSVSKETAKYAEAVAGVSESYAETSESSNYYDDEDEEDGHHTTTYKRVFSDMEEDSSDYLSLDCVNKARIKSYVLAGDYDAIAEELDEDSSYHELMIAAELYMSGQIKKKDFSDVFQGIDKDAAQAVKKRLKAIYEKVQGDLSKKDKKELKARIRSIEKQLDDPVLIIIKQELLAAADDQAGPDRTKVYLELSKIENYFGNEAATEEYLRIAIYTSPENEDDSYVAAMLDIISVISNDEDSETENIKNVSVYVDNVLDHSLTVNVESIIGANADANGASNNRDRYDDDDDDFDEDDESSTDFATTAVDYVSKAKGAITIGKINTDNFEQVKATVQIDSDYATDIDELKKVLKVYDCGAEITDYTIRKIDYTGSNVMLVCDVSGSMAGSMQDLRTAVITFVDDKNEDEDISVVTFDDTICGTCPFGSSDDALRAFAEEMTDMGGTDMFSAVYNCLSSYPSKDGESNVLILMTDGQDNHPRSAEQIYSEIGQLAREKGVTIYTLGLGDDVDTGYLSTIAGSGNGDFVYVSDSASLTSFYNMLHSRVYSQYEITYNAADTFTVSGRTLEVAIPSENIRDIKRYSLGEDTDNEGTLQASQNLSIAGMSPRYLYKGLQDATVKLKGEGFDKDSRITVKLNGNIDYDVTAEFTDSETYTISIPASIAVGSYNVEVSIDGKRSVLQNGFSIIEQGDEAKTKFGPYVFTSAEKIVNGRDDYTLRGAVTMNGWLHFKGDVHISGDLENGGSIRVTDNSGSYVEFDTATAEGIGSYFAEKGVALQVPALYDFTLYNDPEHMYDYSNYLVDDITTGVFKVWNLVSFDAPVLRLYPNSVGVYFKTGTTAFPYQKQILKTQAAAEIFKFTFDGSAQITNKNIGIKLDAEYSDPSEETFPHQINLLNSPAGFNGSVKVKMDTFKNEYMLGAMVRFDFFEKSSGVGAEITWKGHLIPDSVKLELKLAKAVKLPTTVPIEVNDFSFMVSEINKVVENGAWASLKFTGSASFSSCKASEYIPGIEKYLGDISLLEMPDTTASIRVSPFTVEANAKLKFLSEITLAEADVKLGTFDYTNSLLQIDNESVSGVSASLKQGLIWNTADGRVSVDISGTGRLDAHSRFVGVQYTGTARLDIGWWVLNSEFDTNGTVALGLYTTHDGRKQFVLAYRTQQSNGKVKGKFYYIDEDGKMGQNRNVLY